MDRFYKYRSMTKVNVNFTNTGIEWYEKTKKKFFLSTQYIYNTILVLQIYSMWITPDDARTDFALSGMLEKPGASVDSPERWPPSHEIMPHRMSMADSNMEACTWLKCA